MQNIGERFKLVIYMYSKVIKIEGDITGIIE